MKNKRKNTSSVIAIIAVMLVFIIGGILAYLTDTDRKVNNFIIGNVDIVLHEENWRPTEDTDNDNAPDAVIMGFGDNIPKDPSVENIGKNPAYIYLKVFVPVGEYEDGLTTTTNTSIFEYEIDDENWTELVDARAFDGTNNIYVYYYNTALPAPTGDTESITETLFDTINLKDGIKQESIPAGVQSVVVEAYAIQSTGLPQGTTVLNTEWAEEFKTYAGEHPQTNSQTSKISIENCTVSPATIEIENGEYETITVSTEETGAIETYTFTSSNSNVATVDSTGKVTGIAAGTAIITVTGNISGKIQTVDVTIKQGLALITNLSQLSTSNIGDYVNIGTTLLDRTIALQDSTTPKADWRIFDKTEDGTWLILADYLPHSKLPESTGLTKGADSYRVYSDSPSNLVNALKNTTEWRALIAENSSLYNNSNIIVKGALTREEWENSWYKNEEYGEPGETALGNANTLYYSHKGIYDTTCQGYWLASIATEDTSVVSRVQEGNTLNRWYANADVHGVRPVIFIPNNI